MANHKFENKIYAIKVLKKEAIIRRNEVKHIMAERNVLIRNVKHPFLVCLHYSFQSSDKLYFVLDYVNGGEVRIDLCKIKLYIFNSTNLLVYSSCFIICCGSDCSLSQGSNSTPPRFHMLSVTCIPKTLFTGI